MQHNWKNVTILTKATMNEAIECINAEGLRVALVVDDDFVLQGTITDGDIRRALLNHVDLSSSVVDIMNSSPRVASENTSRAKLLSVMQKEQLLSIPIVDEAGKLLNLETLHEVLNRKKRNNPVFLMAGGFGTRLRPMTNNCPKPLLKLGGKPILETILENFIDAGFHQFYISTHFMPEKIRAHFGDGSAWGIDITYVHEEEPLGTGGALGLLPKEIENLPLIMMNGDLLTKVNFTELLDYHESQGALCTMCGTEYEYQVPYGVIETDGHKVASMVEKPVHKFFVNAGIYVIDKALINRVEKNQRIDMPDLLETCIKKDELVSMFPIHEYWLDIGKKVDFHQAEQDLLNGI